TGHVQRLLGPAEAALAVRHEGPQLIAPGHAPGGTELGERLAVLLVGVRGESGRLAHGGDARREAQRHPGVRVGLLGLLADQPGDHHQVPGDVFGQRLRQALELLPYVTVDLLAGDVLRDRQTLDGLTVPVTIPVLTEAAAAAPVVTAVVASVVTAAEAA